MSEIIKNRTIRPSSRQAASLNYKIDTRMVTSNDTLIVNIDHEANPFKKTFTFSGKELATRDSISFKVRQLGTSIEIMWSGVQPIPNKNINIILSESNQYKKVTRKKSEVVISKGIKKSLDSIANAETTILILGTMPGDKSLELSEYYAHPRNRFWKIISTITNNKLPVTYPEKIALLLNSKIGLWDVLHSASRQGSLDIAIMNAVPNDLEDFISKHNHLKVIGFNGTKSEEYYNKYFKRIKGIEYFSLPSSSPANTSRKFDEICKIWAKLNIH